MGQSPLRHLDRNALILKLFLKAALRTPPIAPHCGDAGGNRGAGLVLPDSVQFEAGQAGEDISKQLLRSPKEFFLVLGKANGESRARF